jgi:hypothetical protein
MEKNIQERSEAIALFMGMKLSEPENDHEEYEWIPSHPVSGNWMFKSPPPYDRSWKWLMPVLEKIEAQDNIITKVDSLRTVGGDLRHKCTVHNLSVYGTSCIAYGESKSKIEAIFLAVSHFCMEYNKTQQKDKQ